MNAAPRKANGSTVPDRGILLHQGEPQSREQCRMQLPMCSHPALFRNSCEADELARVEPLGHECEQFKRGRLIWVGVGQRCMHGVLRPTDLGAFFWCSSDASVRVQCCRKQENHTSSRVQ